MLKIQISKIKKYLNRNISTQKRFRCWVHLDSPALTQFSCAVRRRQSGRLFVPVGLKKDTSSVDFRFWFSAAFHIISGVSITNKVTQTLGE